MRPHTRTHCSRKGDCEGEPRCTRNLQQQQRREEGPGLAYSQPGPSSSSSAAAANRHISLVELPAEIIVKILEYMTFRENATVRLVCRRLNELCAGRLNSTFQQLQNRMLVRFQAIKGQMPRRESARRSHPLSRECDIVETLHMRLTLLQMTFGKHIERKHICFFPGEILDEVYRILSYIQSTHSPLGRAYKVTDELFDLSTMAMEYFKENIEPNLPEITYFGSDFLDFTPPFTTPSKKLSQIGGFESPISSRASAVGSSCSEPPLPYNSSEADFDEGGLGGAEAPQSNMVLRKRIKRIRAGMKKYNTQLDEVKRELKSCKSKMDSQSKQVAEYSSRLDEYDKKFEENSRKFGTLLTELNKCKTELQFYRSRAHLAQCHNCGSSLNDQASDSAAGGGRADDTTPAPPLIIPDMIDMGVDKQAMVEDWLNPDTATATTTAPLVQFQQDSLAIQKFSKTEEEPYLRVGPGSPGYTRGGGGGGGPAPKSPNAAASSSPEGGPRNATKRRSREEEEGEQQQRKKVAIPAKTCVAAKGIRPKRPKMGAQT